MTIARASAAFGIVINVWPPAFAVHIFCMPSSPICGSVAFTFFTLASCAARISSVDVGWGDGSPLNCVSSSQHHPMMTPGDAATWRASVPIELDDADAFADLEAYKAILGYVPEEPHMYSYLTGPEYLRLVGRLRGLSERALDDKIERFLQLLGIYDDRYQTLSSYSKGMRQKILVAAAVLHNPRIVILDEPFSGLDVSAARVLKGFVRALADEGKIVVFSSHVLEVVEQVCSRVVILKDGRIVGHDSVANLRATLQLPSLDAVFASLVAEERVEERTLGLLAAMKFEV